MIHAGLLSLDGPANETPQADIDAAWHRSVDSRLEDVLHGRVELGSFEATRARFEAKYPASTR